MNANMLLMGVLEAKSSFIFGGTAFSGFQRVVDIFLARRRGIDGGTRGMETRRQKKNNKHHDCRREDDLGEASGCGNPKRAKGGIYNSTPV